MDPIPVPQPQSRLLVLLFTDLIGSTGLKSTLTTATYLPLLRRHDALLRESVAAANGQLQQDTGDGCFAFFNTSSDAVKAGLLFQWKMNSEPWPTDQRLSSRVGIHLGEVAETEVKQDGGGKLVGLAVDLAARVMSLAQGGQILLTRAAFNDARQFLSVHPAEAGPPLRWLSHGPYLFKGSDEPFDIAEVGVEGQAPLAPPPDSEKARRALRPGEEQTLGWRPGIGLPLPGSPQWIVEKKLGEGGFGEVWLARHEKAKSLRVFKFCFDPERLCALKREVVLFRLLKEALGDRRDIARVIDWRFDESPYFIEMDYAPAGNLADWARDQGGIDKIPLPRRLAIVAQLARALSAAHGVGILHKDIKPTNVLMVQDLEGTFVPRLTDFGIGILTDKSRLDDFNITSAGFTDSSIDMNKSSGTGTRMYSPPESLTEKPHTVQGDIYALGVVLYQMAVADLTRPLGVGWERDVHDDLLREDIAACVDVDPTRRLTAAADLYERIESLEQRRIQRDRVARQAEHDRLVKRRRARVIIGSILAASISVSLIVGFLWHDASKQRAEAIKQRDEAAGQRNEASIQRAAAKREAENALTQEARVRAAFANSVVDAGWKDYDRADLAFAFLRFAESLQIDSTPAQRARAAYLFELSPRLRVAGPTDGFAHPTANELRAADQRPPNAPGAADPKPRATANRAQRGFHALETAYNFNGTRLIASAGDKAVHVVNVATGKPVTPALTHDDIIIYAAFSPDGSKVVTCSADKSARVWDANTGKPLTIPLVHDKTVNFAVFSSNSSKLATVAGNATHIWTVSTGLPLIPPIMLNRFTRFAVFSPDGSKLVTATNEYARVWQATSGKALSPPLNHVGLIDYVKLSADDSKLFTSGGNVARIWLLPSGRLFASVLPHESPVEYAAFSPDASELFTTTGSKTSRVWTSSSSRGLMNTLTHDDAVNAASFSPDGLKVLTASADKSARIWDAATEKLLLPPISHDTPVVSACFSPDSTKFLTTTANTARIYDAASAQPLTPPIPHESPIAAATFSPDSTKILTAAGNLARVYETSTGKPLTEPLTHEDAITSISFSPDGSKILTAGRDRTARIWDSSSGKSLSPPLPHEDTINSACFSPDGTQVLTASSDRTACIWTLSTGVPAAPLITHESAIAYATFSPDGTKVVTASADKTARIWDAITGRPLTPPLLHEDAVDIASFSPDSAKLVTASADKSARVWEVSSGKPLTPPLLHEEAVVSASFSPDGLKLITVSHDRAARIWLLPVHRLSDADYKSFAELISSCHLDSTASLVRLSASQWQKRFTDLSTRYPERFLPPPTQSLFDQELSHTPADPARLKMCAQWFQQSAQPQWSAPLLEKARAAGADIPPLDLARVEWMSNRLPQAAAEYEKALAANQDPKLTPYLTQCLVAVRRDLTTPTTHPSP